MMKDSDGKGERRCQDRNTQAEGGLERRGEGQSEVEGGLSEGDNQERGGEEDRSREVVDRMGRWGKNTRKEGRRRKG